MPTPYQGSRLTGHRLLGLGTIVVFECGELSLTGVDKMPRVCSIPVKRQTALTVFTEGKAGSNPQPTKREARRIDEQLPDSPC